MRKVEFDQGSEEWLKWRRGLLTATDAPMLMGASPYATPYQGWQRKVGQIPEQEENDAMRRGKRDEPIAREWFIKEYGIHMEPYCVESETLNYIGASLDGISSCGKYILEIKSNGDQYHYGLNSGAPEFHFMQMQHQYLSCDRIPEMCFYLSWHRSGPRVLEIKIDNEWLDNYVIKALEFWRRVVFFDPPPQGHKDYKDMCYNNDWNHYADEYRKICESIKVLEEKKERCRKSLITLCGENSCLGNGIKMMKKVCRGRIDYESVKELQGIDLEPYRKPHTSSWMITME